MACGRLQITLDGLLIFSGIIHQKLGQNKKSVAWIHLCLLDIIIFFFHQKMSSSIDLDSLYTISLLPLSINYLWGNCKILKGICCLQLFVCYTVTSVFVVNFLQTLVVASCTFFFVYSPVALYPTPRVQTLWIDNTFMLVLYV